MKTLLIIGGAGFTGTNFADHYLKQGHKVVVVDNLSRKGCLENISYLQQHTNSADLDIVISDILKPNTAFVAAIEQADAVFHFAGQVAVTTSVANPREDFEINALGTFNVLEMIRNSKGNKPPLFFSSTNKVYGGMEDIKVVEQADRYAYKDYPLGIAEDRLLDFHSPYGCSKGAADQYVRDYARVYGLKTVVFRQSCIYGYRQFGIEDQGWVAWFTIAAFLGKPITIYGDGKQVRDVLFISDLVNAYDLALQNIDSISGDIFNIGGGPANTISLLNLIDFLSTELQITFDISYDDWRTGDQPVYISDIRKAGHRLGWTPKTSWNEGVRKLAHWVESNKAMLAKIF
ncbi:MAG: NAD-dependent epimerase/dehydratase family protein [Desulfobacteraceae bacterium]|nr:NAD-dependent epimerase/dehydratase family protein [Desulfobacteraceae bacterium]